jgi:AraC-like DNA-binding protein
MGVACCGLGLGRQLLSLGRHQNDKCYCFIIEIFLRFIGTLGVSMGTALPQNRFSIQHRGPAKGPEYEAWREGICRGFCRLDVSPTEDAYIDCHNEFALLDCVSMATPKGNSARFARTRELLSDGCDDFVLISASRGAVRVTQRSDTIDLVAGQMCLTEMNVIGEASLSSAGGFTTMRFPRRFLLQVAPKAETRLGQSILHNPARSVIVDRYFALCNEVAGDLDGPAQKAAAQHLADLVGLLLGTDAGRADLIGQRGLSAAKLDLMKADVLRSLEWSGLNMGTIARANGLSERQAQRLFAQAGSTFSEFVLEQRLLQARRLLLQASNRTRKVSDIAYAVGFNDLSYFNRSFRRRFDTTPSGMQIEFGQK